MKGMERPVRGEGYGAQYRNNLNTIKDGAACFALFGIVPLLLMIGGLA